MNINDSIITVWTLDPQAKPHAARFELFLGVVFLCNVFIWVRILTQWMSTIWYSHVGTHNEPWITAGTLLLLSGHLILSSAVVWLKGTMICNQHITLLLFHCGSAPSICQSTLNTRFTVGTCFAMVGECFRDRPVYKALEQLLDCMK